MFSSLWVKREPVLFQRPSFNATRSSRINSITVVVIWDLLSDISLSTRSGNSVYIRNGKKLWFTGTPKFANVRNLRLFITNWPRQDIVHDAVRLSNWKNKYPNISTITDCLNQPASWNPWAFANISPALSRFLMQKISCTLWLSFTLWLYRNA